MCKPLSEVLSLIIPYAEIRSSFFGGADEAHRYGDITAEERTLAHRAIARLLKGTDIMTFTARKGLVKDYIKHAKKNEGMPVR